MSQQARGDAASLIAAALREAKTKHGAEAMMYGLLDALEAISDADPACLAGESERGLLLFYRGRNVEALRLAVQAGLQTVRDSSTPGEARTRRGWRV